MWHLFEHMLLMLLVQAEGSWLVLSPFYPANALYGVICLSSKAVLLADLNKLERSNQNTKGYFRAIWNQKQPFQY